MGREEFIVMLKEVDAIDFLDITWIIFKIKDWFFHIYPRVLQNKTLFSALFLKVVISERPQMTSTKNQHF